MKSTPPSPQHPLNLRRYLLATIIPILLLTVSLSLFLYDQLQQYTFIKKEIEGVRTIKMLYGGLTDLQKIRGYSQIFLWGHSEVDGNLQKLKEHFLENFHRKEWLRKVDIFRVQAESIHLYDKAQTLFLIDLAEARSVDLFSEYSQLISEILQLMQLTADRSNLILDPELDTYYLIDILTKQIPYLSESIGKVRGLGSGLIAKGTVSKEETDQLQGFLTIIRTRINNVKEAQTVLSKVAADIAHQVNMLPDDLEKMLTEKMRAAIEGLHILHEGNAPHGVVTVSLGLIEVPAESDCPLERVMPELDQALYAAKEAGRNQYTVAG